MSASRSLLGLRPDPRRAAPLRRAFVTATAPPRSHEWQAFGDRSWIVPPLRVSDPSLVRIGTDVVVLENCWFSVVQPFDDLVPLLEIGDRARIGRGCQLAVAGHMRIGDDVLIGDFVQVSDTYHPYDHAVRHSAVVRPRDVTIGARSVIAGNATILPGVRIGTGAVVDHHAVVTADVADFTVVAGNPARPIS